MQEDGKRDYKHAYKLQQKSGETKDQIERQRARRAYDAAGIDRKGKHIDHKRKIKDGGKSTPGNTRLRSPKANMRDNGH